MAALDEEEEVEASCSWDYTTKKVVHSTYHSMVKILRVICKFSAIVLESSYI